MGPEFLTRRNGTWHFVRRVPLEFAEVDPRGIVRHSTRIRIAHDRAGRGQNCMPVHMDDNSDRYLRRRYGIIYPYTV